MSNLKNIAVCGAILSALLAGNAGGTVKKMPSNKMAQAGHYIFGLGANYQYAKSGSTNELHIKEGDVKLISGKQTNNKKKTIQGIELLAGYHHPLDSMYCIGGELGFALEQGTFEATSKFPGNIFIPLTHVENLRVSNLFVKTYINRKQQIIPAIVLKRKMDNGFSLFTKLGLNFSRFHVLYDNSYNGFNATYYINKQVIKQRKTKMYKVGYVVGLGLSYAVNDKFSIRTSVSYTWYHTINRPLVEISAGGDAGNDKNHLSIKPRFISANVKAVWKL